MKYLLKFDTQIEHIQCIDLKGDFLECESQITGP